MMLKYEIVKVVLVFRGNRILLTAMENGVNNEVMNLQEKREMMKKITEERANPNVLFSPC